MSQSAESFRVGEQGLWGTGPHLNTGGMVDAARKDQPGPSPVELWRNAPAEFTSYPSGALNGYRYDQGRRLLVTLKEGEAPVQVMDTCEAPWAVAAVDAAFSAPMIARMPRGNKVKVLERGAGLNITGTQVINHFSQRGSGEYHVIELNRNVLHHPQYGTYAWRERTLAALEQESKHSGIRYDIDIIVHEGDAREVTKDLSLDPKTRFNIIISDTFPLTPKEVGINDIEDVDVMARMLYKNEGVFTFFSFHPGMETTDGRSHVTSRQLALLAPRFGKIEYSEAHVKPPKGYDYLLNNGAPIRTLPVVLCSERK